MFSNVMITGLGISYPEENVATFDEWRKEYAKKGIRIKSMMKMLGKERSFSSNKEDDYFSLLETAAKSALAEADLTPNDVEMLVVVTDEPEYFTPTNALKLGSILNTQNVKIAYDMNVNCSGGAAALDQVSTYMMQKKTYKHALVVCSFYGSYMRNGVNPFYEMFSDASAAFVLELREEECKQGVIDSEYKSDISYIRMNTFPVAGMKNVILNHRRSDEDITSVREDVDLEFTKNAWTEIITAMLERNGLKPTDVKQYLFSQLNLLNLHQMEECLNIPEDKVVYVGNKYGYNGSCSPYYALYDAKKNGLVKKGDWVVFCTIASGYEAVAVLYKY